MGLFHVAIVGGIVLALYTFTLITYRLFLSPISRFPGPKIAAITFWYEGYYDILRQGRYTWKIQDLHRKYGPIVRINPEELHVQDLSFYDQIYVGATRRTDKWAWSAKMFGTSLAAVGTVPHDLHKIRRSALNPYFSKSAVVSLEPVIQRNVDLLLKRLGEYIDTDQSVNLDDAFTALSADVISSYCFGESYGFLGRKDFDPEWKIFMRNLSQATHLMKQFGWAYQISTLIPEWFISMLHPLLRRLNDLRNGIRAQVHDCQLQTGVVGANGMAIYKRQNSLFIDLLAQSPLPPSELSKPRLTDEGLTLIGAGTVTTAHTMSVIVFHVLSDMKCREKLQAELKGMASDLASAGSKWTTLNQLPYLSAVIHEGLRLSYGTAHRLQRIDPDHSLQYNEWIIPAGTPVSMTQMFIHQDPRIFPDPLSFRPERWLSPFQVFDSSSNNAGKAVDPSIAKKYLVPFSKGTRSCVAMNLAYAELFLTVAAIFKPLGKGGFQLRLHETTAEDMEIVHDFFSPHISKRSEGLRVMISSDIGDDG